MSVTPRRIVDAPNLLEPERVSIEGETLLDVADPHHGVQIPHVLPNASPAARPASKAAHAGNSYGAAAFAGVKRADGVGRAGRGRGDRPGWG